MGLRVANVSALAFSSLNLISASVTTKGDTVGQGAGTGGGLLSLSQVLINGNETAATLIRVNQGGGLLGVTDDAAGDGASFGVFGGATTLATNDTGTLSLGSGNAFGGGAENPGSTTGSLLLSTGFQFGAASMGDTGIARIQTGDHLGPDGTTGDIVLRTGGFFNGAAGVRTQGDILIAPGSFTPNTATVTGEVILKGGSSSLTGVTGGDVTIMSGENSSATGDTGDILVETFSANLSGNSGGLELKTGDAGTVSGDSGNLNIETGDGIAGNTGAIAITTGDAGNGAGGAILLAPGSTTSGAGASVLITGGTTADAGALGGNIVLTPGGGGLGSGEVTINGKLTVTGIIDPPALIMSGSLVAPAALPAAGGEGMLWVDDTVVPSRLIFTNDNNVNTDISTGGGATTLGALTDVTVAAPAVGEVLTLNGALQWVNAAGAGGSPLATILAIGNTTGALPIVVEDSLGARLTSDGNLLLDPSATPGDAVVLDGLRWPEADGAAGFVLTTNGLGQLSFQAGGGGGGSGISFGEAFTRMQWGTVQAATAAPFWGTDGIFTTPIAVTSTSPISGLSNTEGYSFSFDTPAAPLGIGGVEIEVGGSGFGLQARPIISIKFNGPSLDTSVRFFVGLTDAANITAQTGSVAPAQRYVGIQIYTDVPQTTLHFVTDDNTGTPTTFNTGVSALGVGFELVLDATVPGTVTLTLYDNTGAQLSTTSFAANLPLATAILGLQISAMTLNGASKVMSLYGANVVTRGDLLNAVGGGGGGNQDLASVLGFGNETNGTAVKGSDNAAGSGSSLDLLGGASTGGAGVGGAVNVITGAPDPGGVGAGGALVLTTATGAGVGDGGILSVTTGDGGVGGGDGGNFSVTLGAGPGAASGDGGSYLLAAGDGGGTGGVGGLLSLQAGSALAGNDAGGPVSLTSGDGFGTGNGGLFTFDAGDGGAGGGDGGSFLFTAGTGNGGGIDGTITFTGDTTITGKLTVTGLIDPTGLLLDSQGAVPFIPLGSDGGIWVNAASELIFTNSGGDLNLSTAIGGGLTFLDALLTAGYGFLGPGNSIGGPQSYGVFGSSVNSAVSPGPPPASITVGQDSDGPFANLAVAADAGGSEAFLGTSELQIQRDSQFKARFKFQITSPAHTDERLFIGYTDDATQVSPNPQLAVDHPVPGLQYMALVQNFAGFNLEFVAQGSGGAMVAVFAIPTDALVHYFEIDASATTGDVTFTVYAADGITVQATHTELASFLIPDLANPLRPLVGITNGTSTTTPRSIDFYDATVVTRADVVDAVTGGGGAGGTSPLSAVLAAGNTTGGLPILVASSVDGDGVDLLLNGGAAGGAADVAHLTLESESGDDGGDAILVAGDGAGAAGNGGELRIGGRDGVGTGDGGDTLVTAGSADTGIAGDIQLSAGDATGLTGTGGAIQLSGGDSFGTMDGGAVTLIGGDGGVGPGTGDGGNVELLAGTSGGAGGEGKIRLFAGSASPLPVLITLDSIQVVSSPYLADPLSSSSALFTRGTVGKGGDVQFKAGSGAAGSGGIGGDIELRTGGGDGGADGGRILILGGGAAVASSLSPGGDVQMVGGADSGNAMGALIHADGGSPLFGGVATVQGGAAIIASGLDGGAVNVTGGAGDGVAEGGAVNIVGGEGGATGTGGTVQIRGGEATGGANTGGDVQLIGGAGPAGDGVISIEGRLNNFASGFQFGSPAIPGVGTFVIGFNSVFPTIPRLVQVSIEATVAAVGGAANGFNIMVAPGSITAVGFTLDAVAIGAVPGPITVNWVAYA